MNTISPWEECTDSFTRETGGERWIRKIDPTCWISVLHRLTGFGYMEWETAIVFKLEPGSRPRRFGPDDLDVLIIRGDHRDTLATMPKEELRKWYESNIEGNRNSMESLIQSLKT